jgi:hypothetical protein
MIVILNCRSRARLFASLYPILRGCFSQKQSFFHQALNQSNLLSTSRKRTNADCFQADHPSCSPQKPVLSSLTHRKIFLQGLQPKYTVSCVRRSCLIHSPVIAVARGASTGLSCLLSVLFTVYFIITDTNH